ncbi:hypothetical protein [Luteimonas notoginsengisoli]|uniref:Phage tail protein n=1 Tax=Luteimonas notoginsengisoli TaxID=1578200 RepID=A0ABV7URD3_9GAMM
MARESITAARTSNRAIGARVRARLSGLSEAALNRSIQRTLAGAKRRFEPAAKRVIRDSYGVKARDLSGKFSVRTGLDDDGEYVALAAGTKGIPLLSFGGRWRGPARRKGRWAPAATAEVRKGDRKTYSSAFIATINGTRRLVARQLVRGAGGARDPRNRLRTLTGPSPVQMVEGDNDRNAQAIADEVNTFMADELARQVLLSRGSK